MIEFTPEQIQENWNKLIQLIEDTFEGERKEKLLEMYSHFEDRMCMFNFWSITFSFMYTRWLCTTYLKHCTL